MSGFGLAKPSFFAFAGRRCGPLELDAPPDLNPRCSAHICRATSSVGQMMPCRLLLYRDRPIEAVGVFELHSRDPKGGNHAFQFPGLCN